MIEQVFTKELWAHSLTAETALQTVTIHVGNERRQPRISAQINLARVEGHGTAKAAIARYATIEPIVGEVGVGIEPPLSPGDPGRLTKGLSTITLGRASSVTFLLVVNNMFALANCTVFVYEDQTVFSRLVSDEAFGPIRELVRRISNP